MQREAPKKKPAAGRIKRMRPSVSSYFGESASLLAHNLMVVLRRRIQDKPSLLSLEHACVARHLVNLQ
jgi:hypothetical protein